MGHTCNICSYTHSCWCGGKRCKCGLNLGENKLAMKLINTYKIEDTATLVALIKKKLSLTAILNELGIQSTVSIAGEYIGESTILDVAFARELGMKSVYCEYSSFNDNAQCTFCERIRKEGYLKPCLYYISKIEGTT